MPNNRYLYICGMIDKDDPIAAEMRSIDVSANTLSMLFYDGFKKNLSGPVDVIRDRYGLLYPVLPRVTKRMNRRNSDGAIQTTISYLNRNKALKMFSKTFVFAVEAINWALKYRKSGKAIILYSLHFPYITAALAASLFLKNAGLYVIVPDLPMFMDPELKQKKIKYFFKSIENYLYRFLLRLFRGFIVLSEDTAAWLKRYNKKVYVIPGMISSAEAQLAVNRTVDFKETRYILYTGSLEERYGLKDLLEAFNSAGIENCDLIICGDGNYRDEIIKMSRVSEKIKYLGSLPRERALELQRDAALLVNPRSSAGDFTKFSFPSKTMEYLLSGTPVLMRPVPGIIPEFEELVFLDSEQTVQSLSYKMQEILELAPEKIKEKTEKAIEYIARSKTEVAQTAVFCEDINLQTHK